MDFTASLPEIQSALRATLRERLSTSLHEFVQFFWHTVDGSTFMDNWHVKAICDHLEAVSDGRIKRLMIMLPPRHAKSIIVNVFFPVWDWLRTPSRRFLTASVDEMLAHGFVNKSRSLIESDDFKWLFGDIVEPSKRDWGKSFYANTAKGSRLAMTTAGGTGKDADLLICDDPMQAAKAWSAAERERAWRWYTGTFKTRGTSQEAGEVLVMQRLHEDDVMGRLLANPRIRALYDILCLPAEYEANHPIGVVSSIGFKDPRTQEGELLWASRFPKEWVDERNDELGKQIASAQLQQRPAPVDGLIFADEMFPVADVTELAVKTGAEKVIISIDCTFKVAANSDYVAMLVFVRFRGKWYLVDGVNERLDFVATLKTIKATADKWMPHEFLVEDKANGTAVIRMMRDHFNNVTAICPSESKESRAFAASAILLRENVLFFKQQPVVDALIDQALQFPMGRHDDLVDSLTQFVNKVLNVRQPSMDWLGFGGV